MVSQWDFLMMGKYTEIDGNVSFRYLNVFFTTEGGSDLNQ